jgi:hypothetical protein
MKFLIPITMAMLALIACTPPASKSTTGSSVNSLDEDTNGTVQQYGGSVGSRYANFQLTWKTSGNVVGSYEHPADHGAIRYQLKGINTADGQLVLTEYTQGRQTAILTLNKSISQSLITWSGTMHNTDGRVIPVSFTRNGP